MNKLTYIYVLKDPDTNLVRYVGKTILKPAYRFTQHLNDSKKCKTHKDRWINKLSKEGKIPLLEIIDETDGDWVTMEQSYIRLFKSIGCNLCNHSMGGEGAFGVKRPLYQRVLQSEYMKKHSENWVINKISKEENRKHLNVIRNKSIKTRSKPVYEYNILGEIINTFLNCNVISKSYNNNHRGLQKILKLNNEIIKYSYHERLFSRNPKGIVEIFEKKKPHTSLKIKVEDIETNIITEYTSVNEFIKILGKKVEYKNLKKYQLNNTIILSKYKIIEFNYNPIK